MLREVSNLVKVKLCEKHFQDLSESWVGGTAYGSEC